jgi:aminoglycoside/choline kinase family phosphotransferase
MERAGEGDEERSERWIAERLREHGFPSRAITPLTGDVSPRRYSRVALAGGGSAILASYPETLRSTAARFLRTGELLAGVGVRVPRVLAADVDAGWMLVEDLGHETLYERRLGWRERRPWWLRAGRVLTALRGIDPAVVAALNPPLDQLVFARELEQTRELVLAPALDSAALLADVLIAFTAIGRELGHEPAVPCHRDFMARNLVPLLDRTLAVLDHQDLRLGPASYDWASLLNDSLFAPPALERDVLAVADRLDVTTLSYHRAAAQRGFKAAGTFVSFARRGSDRHLPLVASTLGRALDHLAQTPEGQGVARPLRTALIAANLLQ